MIHINKIKKTYIPPTVDVIRLGDENLMQTMTGYGKDQESGYNGEDGDGGDVIGNAKVTKFKLGVDFSAYFDNGLDEEVTDEEIDYLGW